MITAANAEAIYSKRKAITAFFPHAIWREKNGQHRMLDTFIHTARASQDPRFMWCWIIPHVATLLERESSVSLKWAAVLVSPHLLWWGSATGWHMIQPWAEASFIVPYTDEIGYSVVDTLLRIASNDSLRPYIPIWMWSWLNRCPRLPPVCTGRYLGSTWGVGKTVQELMSIETLKSYLLLIWSEWDCLYDVGYHGMCAMLRKDFSGTVAGQHREDLLQHLNHILGQLDLGLEHLQQCKPSLDRSTFQRMKEQYGKLKEVLVEVGVVASSCKSSRLVVLLYCSLQPTYTDRHSTFMCAIPPPCP